MKNVGGNANIQQLWIILPSTNLPVVIRNRTMRIFRLLRLQTANTHVVQIHQEALEKLRPSISIGDLHQVQ